MKEIRVGELRPGDVVGKTVFGKNGIVMLESGTVLTAAYIERLRALGFARVAVRGTEERAEELPARERTPSAAEAGAELRDPADIDRLKQDPEARKGTEEAIRSFAESEATFAKLALPLHESARFRRAFRDRMLEAAGHRPIADELGVMRQTDAQLFGHSLQVSLLAGIAGDVNGYDANRMYELTVASLLFDIGMTRLPESLIKAKRKLTEAERKTIREHTRLGYQVLSGIKEVPVPAARSALLHHERFNGGGYPLAFKGKDIPELAQLIGLADVYDALLSRRHHRDPYPSNEAMEYLFAAGNYDFGMEIIQLFLKHIAVFPVSSVVLLSNGQLGVVETAAGRLAHRPVVRIIREANGEAVLRPYSVDLNADRHLVIVRTVPDGGIRP